MGVVPLRQVPGETWMLELDQALPWDFKKDGSLRPTSLLNAALMIEHHPELERAFVYDNFRDLITVTKPLGQLDTRRAPRALSDNDEMELALWLNVHGVTVAVPSVAAIIRRVAFKQGTDRLRDFISPLEWDGKERITNWLTTYAGVEETPATRLIGRKFLISAIARALKPGCKVDTMLILEGPQGIRKSSLARELCGPEWFADQLGDIRSKDSSQLIQGNWIIEVPEMDKLNRHEANAVKEYVSRQRDIYRPPYGRNVVNRARRCVFIGTINPNGVGYIKDSTGGRRFWPVRCTDIDLELVQRDRTQLWAEALAAYRAGDHWWLNEEEARILEPEQASRIDDDLWDDRVASFLESDGHKGVTSSSVLYDALGIKVSEQDQRMKNRISDILTRFGYENRVERMDDGSGKRKPARVWRKA